MVENYVWEEINPVKTYKIAKGFYSEASGNTFFMVWSGGLAENKMTFFVFRLM